MAMFLIDNNETTDPALNLALEEYCLRNLDPGYAYVLFYINRPSVIIGRHQNPFQEYNHKLAQCSRIRLVRRISGGGAVYHDAGNLNFSFITDFTAQRLDYFKTLLTPIINTLRRLGVPVRLTEKNNMRVDGDKVSGNSQHTDMRRMLSHGTLLFDSDLNVLQRALDSHEVITQSRAVASIRSPVTNISQHLHHPMGMQAFRAAVADGVSDAFGPLDPYRLTAQDWAAIRRLVQKKYDSWDWTFGRSPAFAVEHEIGVASGKVDVRLFVNHGIIEGAEPVDRRAELSSLHHLFESIIGRRYDVWCLQS